jgi:hypothetical protein
VCVCVCVCVHYFTLHSQKNIFTALDNMGVAAYKTILIHFFGHIEMSIQYIENFFR